MQHANQATAEPETTSVDAALLATKLYVPRIHASTVPRPRLAARLDTSLTVPLTLVAAPAGFGKTTVVAQWIHQQRTSAIQPSAVAWLSLDATDSDPVMFLRYLVAALRGAVPQVGATSLALLSAAHPSGGEAMLIPLLNELATLSHDVVLVLDDYHVLHAPAIHQAVAFFIEHAPPGVHLIITTREDPALPLTRLRARRQLVEIRAADLRFTVDEAAAFLRDTMRLPLSAADIAALEQRTEGWIAGLHLAAIAIQDRRDVTDFVQALEASHRFIVEYLVEEVVKQLPAHLYQFLLQTAVLDRFCAPLCDAVLLGEADPHDSYSQLLIEQLERLNLFLVPIDNEQRWYRYHHLFGEALRERLQAGVSQETINRLHKRASIWYTQHAFIPDGIQHAVAATDWDFAAGLVEHYTEAYLKRGEYSTVQRWVSLLPDTVVSSRPRLGLINTAVCIWMFQLDQAQIALQHVEQSARRANLYEQFQGEVLAQQSAIAYRRMQYQEAVERAQEALAHVPLDQEALRAHVLLSLGNAANFCNQLDTALQAYAEARRLGLAAGDTHTAVRSIAEQGLIYTTQGRLHQAASTYREGLVLAAARGVDHLPMVDGLHHGLTDVLYEWNDLEAASAHLKTAIEIGERWRNPYVLRAKIDFAYILQAQGRGAIASQVIQDIIDVATKENLAPLVISANMCQVRMWLAQGDTDSAGAWLLASGLAADEGSSTKPHDLIVARVLLAQGHTKLALRLLARLHTSEQAAGRAWRLVEIIAIQALAHHASGDTALALTTLKHALVMAEAEGYIRTFVDEGEPMRRLLQEAARQNIMPQYVAKLLDAFGAPAGLHAASPAALALPEPLNEREWEVLRLIAKGHSNREIADQLVVALSTVKWHISNLYGKLGIATRTQALARARELGLL